MSDIVNVTIASQASQVVKISSVGVQGAGSDILAYLQSLPATLPSTPNMPWWDDNVLKRSAVATTFSFFRPGGTDSYIRPSSGTYLRA